jgi:hypothetical protein
LRCRRAARTEQRCALGGGGVDGSGTTGRLRERGCWWKKQEQRGERGKEVQEKARGRYATYDVQPWARHSWGGWREFCGSDISR